MIRIAINGFGRIGRMVARALIESQAKDFVVIAVNDPAPLQTHLHLLRWDSVHGPLKHPLESWDSWINFHNHNTLFLAERSPENLPWKDMDIDIVMECSGLFTNRNMAAMHLKAGAKRVIISAPSDNADLTVVYGVNHPQLSLEHRIISNASCTTNCLAPVASILDQAFGIEHGYMTTIHAYTGDQSLHDKAHPDLARARAAHLSIVPTTTGAAKALGLVLPSLKGKCDGTAIRVPTANVSMIDFVFTSAQELTKESINQAMINAAAGHLSGILAINDLPLVSIDFNHHSASSIFDVHQTQVIQGKMGRVLAWYDNEWGFSNRMLDVARYWAAQGF